MTNTEFKIDNFSGVTTLAKYIGILDNKQSEYNAGEIKNYIPVKKKDIAPFLTFCRNEQSDLFGTIASMGKTLYYCEKDELKTDDINKILALIIGLGEIGEKVSDIISDMTAENTFSLTDKV